MKNSSLWPSANKCIEESSPFLCRGSLIPLGNLDQIAQTSIRAASNRGVVITRSIAVSTAMGFERKNAKISKPHITEGTRKETELMFFCLIAEKIE